MNALKFLKIAKVAVRCLLLHKLRSMAGDVRQGENDTVHRHSNIGAAASLEEVAASNPVLALRDFGLDALLLIARARWRHTDQPVAGDQHLQLVFVEALCPGRFLR